MGNAGALGVDLEKADLLVLSHGHFDHTGGVWDVLRMAPRARLVLHPEALAARYSLHPGKPARSIGMPQPVREALERVPPERMSLVYRPVEIAPGIGASGPVPRETSFEDPGGPFYLDPEGKREDPIPDDQFLWLRSARGIIVCAGCSHAGLINTLNHARRLTKEAPILAALGGFHLLQAGRGRLGSTLEALERLSPGLLAPGHCTGDEAVNAFKRHFPGRVSPIGAGMTFRF